MKFLRKILGYWIRFGNFLGDIMAVVVLTIVYWLVVGPLAVLSWLFRADFLALRQKGDSFWQTPDESKNKHDLDLLKLPF